MKKLILCIALFVLVVSGCDNKDNSSTGGNTSPTIRYLVVATVIMRPGLEFLGTITSIYGAGNDIDSVLIGDSVCTIAQGPSYIEGNQYTYNFEFSNYDDSLSYASGDTAMIRIVRGTEIAVVPVKLLELPGDSLKIISPANQSTVAVGQNINLVWQKVQSADWYGIWYIHDTPSSFYADLRQVYDFTTDTMYTISGAEHPKNSDYRIFITPTTGPLPGTDGNIESPTITGSIYSAALPGVREGWQVQVGTGAP